MDEFKDKRNYWLALSVCDGIGPVRFHKLLHHFGSARNAWKASLQELKESGIGEKIARGLIDFKSEFSLEAYEARLQKLQVSYLTLQDKNYPQLLKQIKNPPIILYKKGTYTFNENDVLVSVVGTRKITEYGRQVTEFLVSDLVAARCVIVSGLAIGVDAVAAEATIAADGKTIAVLGSGVDLCTPVENLHIYNSILEGRCCIVSEYPLGMKPNKGSFPARNRIIAGLSLGVLDVGTNQVETVSALVKRGKEALKYLPKEQLILAPDCGMLELTRTAAKKKLSNLTAAAKALNE